MFEYAVIGGGFAFAAAIMPGPLQAFLLASVARSGWRRTLPAAVAPVISDGPIAALMLLVLGRLPESMGRALQAAGSVFLVYLAWAGLRQWRRAAVAEEDRGDSAPRTLLQAVVVNLLNPNPYLGWSLVLGPACLEAWRDGPVNAVALVASFYGTMVLTLGGIIFLFGTTRFLGPGSRRALILVSAVTLGLLGLIQLGKLLVMR